MLTKELELVRVSGERTKDELEGTETAIRDLEKQLKQKEWELTDEKNMNRAKVAELEAEMEQLRSVMSKSQERCSMQACRVGSVCKGEGTGPCYS